MKDYIEAKALEGIKIEEPDPENLGKFVEVNPKVNITNILKTMDVKVSKLDKLLCRIGIHKWTEWSYPKSGVIMLFQYRHCVVCNKYEERYY